MEREPPRQRRGFAVRGIALGMAMLLAASFVVRRVSDRGGPFLEKEPLTCAVVRGEFVQEILVRGEVESAVNVDVRCEVRTEDRGWVQILEVVPEGTVVQPGDFLIRLDSSAFEADLNMQQVVCEETKALVAKSEAAYQSAQTAKKSYLEGDFRLAREKAEMGLFVAQEKARKAREFLDSSHKLAARGYVNHQQLQADEFSLEAAETEVQQAEIQLSVLEQLTKPKMLGALESAIVTAQARLMAAKFKYETSLKRLAAIQEQIDKCTILAPVAGQVVLNHLYHDNHAHMVQPGEQTMQNRVLVRLPDFKHMQVKANINEDKIAKVVPGLAALLRPEAYPEVEIRGKVTKVSEYPEAETHLGSAIKQYPTTIALEDPPVPLRPGLSGEVRIQIERTADVLQVPCQAVLKQGDEHYCLDIHEGFLEAHQVTLGQTNGRMVVVRGGLEEGQRVVLNAGAYRREVSFTEPMGDD